MSSVVEELARQMAEGEVDGTSPFKVRNDHKRTKTRVRKISKIELAKGKVSKLLVVNEVAFPFNPATGVPDEVYNEETKYRPLKAVTNVCLAIKKLAHTNEVLKATMLKTAGKDSWDTSSEEYTAEDASIFNKYKSPRYFTLSLVKVKDPRITGRDMPVDYRLDVARDELGMIVGDVHPILEINRLYQQLQQNRINDYNQARQAAKEDRPYEMVEVHPKIAAINLRTIKDDDYNKIISEIRQEIPVTDDQPTNFVMADEFVLDGNMNMVEATKFGSYTLDDMERSLRLVKCNKAVKGALESVLSGTLKTKDIYPDFIELEMECPTVFTNPTGNDKRDLGGETKFDKPTNYLREDKEVEKTLIELFRKQQDTNDNLEQRFLVSSYAKPLEDDVVDMLLDLMVKDNILKHPYMSQQVVQYNKKILERAFGDEFIKILTKIDIGLVPANMLNMELDEKEAAIASSQANLEDFLNSGGDDFALEGEEQDTEEEDKAEAATDEVKESQESEGTISGAVEAEMLEID